MKWEASFQTTKIGYLTCQSVYFSPVTNSNQSVAGNVCVIELKRKLGCFVICREWTRAE